MGGRSGRSGVAAVLLIGAMMVGARLAQWVTPALLGLAAGLLLSSVGLALLALSRTRDVKPEAIASTHPRVVEREATTMLSTPTADPGVPVG